MFRYILPSVGQALKLDRKCPDCHKNNGNIHSRPCQREIRDLKVSKIYQQRMKGPFWGLTWTIRPEGVGPGRWRSERLNTSQDHAWVPKPAKGIGSYLSV